MDMKRKRPGREPPLPGRCDTGTGSKGLESHGEGTAEPSTAQADELPPIEVKDLRPVRGTGTIRAFATVAVGAWKVYGFKVVQYADGEPWVSLPQNRDRNGAYWPTIEVFDKPLRLAIEQAILEAYRKLPAPEVYDDGRAE